MGIIALAPSEDWVRKVLFIGFTFAKKNIKRVKIGSLGTIVLALG